MKLRLIDFIFSPNGFWPRTKQAFSIALLIASGFAHQASAQVDATISPGGFFLFSNFFLGSDFVLSDNVSLEARIGGGYSRGSVEELDYEELRLPVNMLIKYYFNPERGADKLYVNGFLGFVHNDLRAANDSGFSAYRETRFGTGIGLGYKLVTEKRFVLDVGINFWRPLIETTVSRSNTDGPRVSRPSIVGGRRISLGYRFGGKKAQVPNEE